MVLEASIVDACGIETEEKGPKGTLTTVAHVPSLYPPVHEVV